MFVVYRHVRDVERKALKYSFLARLRGKNNKKNMKRSRRVMIQGILYSVTMLLLYIFVFIHVIVAMITKKDIILVLVLIVFTITPLQGVFNVTIYLIPVFRKKLKTYRQSKGNDTEQTRARRSLILTMKEQIERDGDNVHDDHDVIYGV